MSRLRRLHRSTAPATESRYAFDDWLADAMAAGLTRPATTWGDQTTEAIGNNFEAYVNGAYKANGVIFAIVLARLLLFTEARFAWQHLKDGKPGSLFWNPDLEILERPWPNGNTGDLLSHAEQDVSLAGNAYTARRSINGSDQLRRLRPDHTSIVLGSHTDGPEGIDSAPIGYLHWPGGVGTSKPEILLPEWVSHYAPIPDPTARYRGMSWLTPVLEEIRSDTAATRHKAKFFDNAATPNLAVTLDKALPKKEFVDFIAEMRKHEGVENAYKTLWLGGGADVKVVGADLRQLSFAQTQGAGETRMCAAGGVPPIIVGVSEGLQAATYSNYSNARRKFGDHWGRPAWRSVCGALESIVPRPPNARLWVDLSDVAFLQEDMKDAAEIFRTRAQTLTSLVRDGFTAESAVDAVEADDLHLLKHTGLLSVQLRTPQEDADDPGGGDA